MTLRWISLAAVMALMVAEPAMAQAPQLPPYDGTGSAFLTWSGDRPYSKEAHDKAVAARAEQRRKLEQGAAKGNLSAMIELATLLEQGDDDRPIDMAAAYDLYEKAAARGDILAREKMCVAYLLGQHRPRDVVKGMPICNSLGLKDPAGLFSGGYDYDKGLSGPVDENMALSVYVEAGKLGSGDAMDAIGQHALAAGQLEGARKWFRQGVFLGSADAMDHLAAMAEAGQGGPVDSREAYWLYVNAARRGNAHAAARVAALPESQQPLERLNLLADGRSLISETVTTDKGTETRPFDLWHNGNRLANYFPAGALYQHVDGGATIHCYINDAHAIDVCIRQRELPQGYGFGAIISALFNGRLTVTDRDANGRQTAGGVFVVSFKWIVN